MGFPWSSSDQQQQASDCYNQVNNADPNNQASLSHELIAGAASFEAAKAYENHEAENGAPPSHAMAKELMAAAAGSFVDRTVETKGLDYIDREKAKREATAQATAQLGDDSGNY